MQEQQEQQELVQQEQQEQQEQPDQLVLQDQLVEDRHFHLELIMVIIFIGIQV